MITGELRSKPIHQWSIRDRKAFWTTVYWISG